MVFLAFPPFSATFAFVASCWAVTDFLTTLVAPFLECEDFLSPLLRAMIARGMCREHREPQEKVKVAEQATHKADRAIFYGGICFRNREWHAEGIRNCTGLRKVAKLQTDYN